ncbi:MAG TPA: cupredoxin domain-containing protein [Acidimicrobiia bacterium]|nr:cupredoxin domain-containing protein [Acidimicrobiia bacterium]
MRVFVSIVLAAAMITACGGDDGALSPSDAVATTEVDVVDNEFVPSVIEIEVGDTVTWTWGGQDQHDVAGDGFESEVQTSGTFSHTFESPGEYDYVCNIHADMEGLVVVGG